MMLKNMDVLIIGIFFAILIGIGLYNFRKTDKSSAEFFSPVVPCHGGKQISKLT